MEKGTLFNYKYAIVCRSIPNSIKQGLSLHEHDGVNVDLAIKEHDCYLKALKDCGLKLIEVDGDEKYPDCVFVEDTAVAIGNKIFITNPGALSRRGEIDAVKQALQNFIKEENNGSNLVIGEINNKDEAIMDGGDVCFTGRELLVGISSRTNQKGADELGKFFHDIPVTTINVSDSLHLKSVLTMGSIDTIIISKTAAGRYIHEQIADKSKFISNYKFIEVEDDKAANVVLINSKLIYPSRYKDLYENIEQFKKIDKQASDNNEFAKIDGCLTCRSVLF